MLSGFRYICAIKVLLQNSMDFFNKPWKNMICSAVIFKLINEPKITEWIIT